MKLTAHLMNAKYNEKLHDAFKFIEKMTKLKIHEGKIVNRVRYKITHH